MAINKQALSLLFELKKDGFFGGNLCQLGRQTILMSPEAVKNCAKKFGYEVESSVARFPWTGNASDDYVFRSLGYANVSSFDVDNFEDATHVVDLNQPISRSFEGTYDGVYDGGTSEHVFHIPNLLETIDKILKPGGIVMHTLPCNNFVDHGFYMFSPTFLYDYYEANGYQIIRSNIIEIYNNLFGEKWKIYEYKPLSIEHLTMGGWGSSMLGIWIVAKKIKKNNLISIPLQSRYRKVWASAEENVGISGDKDCPLVVNKLLEKMKKNRRVYMVLNLIRQKFWQLRQIKKNNKKPKCIAIY